MHERESVSNLFYSQLEHDSNRGENVHITWGQWLEAFDGQFSLPSPKKYSWPNILVSLELTWCWLPIGGTILLCIAASRGCCLRVSGLSCSRLGVGPISLLAITLLKYKILFYRPIYNDKYLGKDGKLSCASVKTVCKHGMRSRQYCGSLTIIPVYVIHKCLKIIV